MVSLLLQILICPYMFRYLYASGCEGYFKNCCPESSWNSETQQCEECMPGYSGVNCSSLCPYPYYGEDCQRTCICSRDLCNVSTGCIRIVTVVCPLPPDIPNAEVTVENNTARYFCNPGYYQLENTDDFISCDGNIWQPTNFECILRGDCEPGYFGRNCRGKCIYPYYGEECRGQCDCDEDNCDVSIGCTNVTKVRKGDCKHPSLPRAEHMEKKS